MLKVNGNVVPHHNLRPLHLDELHSPEEVKKRETVDDLIERIWGTLSFPPSSSTLKFDNDKKSWDEYHYQDEPAQCIPEIENTVDIGEKILCQQPAYDKIINARVLLQNGYEVQSTRVLQLSIGPNRLIIVKYDDNPFLNSIVYDIEFPDGTIK